MSNTTNDTATTLAQQLRDYVARITEYSGLTERYDRSVEMFSWTRNNAALIASTLDALASENERLREALKDLGPAVDARKWLEVKGYMKPRKEPLADGTPYCDECGCYHQPGANTLCDK